MTGVPPKTWRFRSKRCAADHAPARQQGAWTGYDDWLGRGDFYIFLHDLMVPGLVNIQKAMDKSPCSIGKSTISMVILNSYVKLPEGNCNCLVFFFTFHPTHPIWENDVDEKYWDGLKPPTTCVGWIYWFLDLWWLSRILYTTLQYITWI